MIDLPKTTRVDRFVPKEKFYTKTTMNTALQRLFVKQVEKITWKYKLSPETLNVAASQYDELQIFEIVLKGEELDAVVVKHIDESIPYPILFILKKEKGMKTVMAYKEVAHHKGMSTKVVLTVETPWGVDINLELRGHSIDEIYKHYLTQIAPKLLTDATQSLAEMVQRYIERQKIEKQIAVYQKKIANEPSLAKKQELARERYELEKRLS